MGARYTVGGGSVSSIQATRLRKGMLIKLGDDLLRLLELTHLTPGKGRAFVQARMLNIRSGASADHKFRSEDTVERAVLDDREMQYLYEDGGGYHFMDTETFEQTHMSGDVLGKTTRYLIPNGLIRVQFYGEEPVGIDLPQTVELKVEDTPPSIKGATASAQIKPAKLETGLVVQVPAFINIGDTIRVNTETGDYQSRV